VCSSDLGGPDSLLEIDFSACQRSPTQLALRVRFEPEHLQRVLVNLPENRTGKRPVRERVKIRVAPETLTK